MKLLITIPTILAAGLIPLASQAATFTSDPVGYTTTTATNGADTLLGTPLYRATVLEDTATGIASGIITATADLTGADYTTEAHFVLMTSGANAGQFYTITANDATTITIDLNGGSDPAAGTYKVIPFWTLDTLFPGGEGVGVSTDVNNPSALVFFNNLTASGVNVAPNRSYFYHDGSSGFVPSGWIENGNLFGGTFNDEPISPETFVRIRNTTGVSSDVVVAGSVPTDLVGTVVNSISTGSQDNQLVNPYPADLTLASSGLFEQGIVSVSADVNNPGDLVFIYGATSGTNPAPASSYFYHDGSSGFVPAGWIENGNLFGGTQESVTIPAGGAFVVRKASTLTNESTTWNPPLPYAL